MGKKEDFPELLTPEEVGDLLKIATSTVYKYLREGKIPGIRIGSVWRVNKIDLLTLLESKKTGIHPYRPKDDRIKHVYITPEGHP